MQTTQAKNQTGGILGLIERVGNKIPDITILFIGAFIICCIMSAILRRCTLVMCIPLPARKL